MSEYLKKITKPLYEHRKITIAAAVVLVFFLSFLITYFKNNITPNIQLEITPYSSVTRDTGRTVFSLNTNNKYLYKSENKKGLDAAKEFLKSNPSIGGSEPLFPTDYSKNANITRQIHDINDEYLKKNGLVINNEHYFFDQKINGIPVYGATVVVHLKNGNEVYSTSGNISTSLTKTSQKIAETKAIQIALNQAKIESKTDQLEVEKTLKYYMSDQVLGLSNDSKNKLALEVMVKSKGKPIIFRTQYFVSLTNGKVLYSESQTRDLLNRNIYTCTGSSCSKVRSEGGPAAGDTEADNLYSYFNTVYAYYKNTFNRDSYDNSGASYDGYVHVPSGMHVNGSPYANVCPNAQWNGSEMVFCTGFVLPDVTGHELTHALTSQTAGLLYSNESGALNEAVSDIFGSAMDSNWDIGEGLSPSSGLPVPLRSMSNPPSRNQPDKLSTYTCGSLDNGGVHFNSGIINKAFYLMTDGGNFNGCTTSGIGRAKSHPIVYQALTKYLSQTSNFKDVYATFLQACGDLYGVTSTECDNVNRAMQATLIDQQPQGSPQSPVCTGATLQPATCATAGSPSPNPTSSITPTGTSTLTPTTTPGAGTATPTPVQGSSDGWSIKATSYCSGLDPQIKVEYIIPAGRQGVIELYNSTRQNACSVNSPIDDWSCGISATTPPGTTCNYLKSSGTYVITGNMITSCPSPKNKLVVGENYKIELYSGDTGPAPSGGLFVGINFKPVACSVSPTLASQPTPTTPPFQKSSTPTPTPDQFFTCKPDPKCVASGKSMQLCPLKCSPQ